MSILASFDAAAINDFDHYAIDWTDYLEPGDTIASATVVEPTGVLAVSPVQIAKATTSVWVTTSVAGNFIISYSIVTALGRHATRSVNLPVVPL